MFFDFELFLCPLAWGMPGLPELSIILVVALLLFGKRLPEVMRSMGRGIVEFKRGLRGVEEEIDGAEFDEPQLSSREKKIVSEDPGEPRSPSGASPTSSVDP